MIFFTSDQHFGHINIIAHCGRPFESVAEMDAELAHRHNSIVKPDDEVWHLGDFALDERRLAFYLGQLNGTHRLIAGNHDRCHPCHHKHLKDVERYLDAGFQSVGYKGRLRVDGLGDVYLTHLPPVTQTGEDIRYHDHRPTKDDYDGVRVMLCGHVHEKWLHNGKSINVGVDQWGFAPVSLPRLIGLISELGL